MNFSHIVIIFSFLTLLSCSNSKTTTTLKTNENQVLDSIANRQEVQKILTGAEQYERYSYLLKDRKVGLIVNHTSLILKESDTIHLVDFLIKKGVDIQTIFAPEHGFRGKASAGETIKDGKDIQTGIPIISLYGKNKKPTPKQLKNLDILVFDIQDVGARFYTYISTMHYCMEAAAQNKKQIIILDRPNPNGFYIDGCIREKKYKSFVGMHPIPIVHGLTVAELAKMIDGEKWLENQFQLKENLIVIPCQNYSHKDKYTLPVPPSPNLPTQNSILLYPSLCLFEGTTMSVGRGTNFPFEVAGHPNFLEDSATISFTPQSNEGAKYPPFENQICYGIKYSFGELNNGFSLKPILQFYKIMQNKDLKDDFFNSYCNTLAGNKELQSQIKKGLSEAEIKANWQDDLNNYKKMRKKYLIYTDFE